MLHSIVFHIHQTAYNPFILEAAPVEKEFWRGITRLPSPDAEI